MSYTILSNYGPCETSENQAKGIHMRKQYFMIALMVLTSALLITGCQNAKPFEYHSDNEISEGPGIFSKDKGKFTIYDSNKDDKSASETSSADGATQAADGTKPLDQSKLDNDQDFKAFQAWKADQKEFEAFEEWKRSKDSDPEYKEFQEWQRWKEYKKWSDSKTKKETK